MWDPTHVVELGSYYNCQEEYNLQDGEMGRGGDDSKGKICPHTLDRLWREKVVGQIFHPGS